MNRTLLEEEIRRDEGVRAVAYRDSVGLWTIGVGHLLPPGDHQGLTWSAADIETTFQQDLQVAIAVAQSLPAYACLDSDARQRALVNMCFQLGGKIRSFQTFLLLLKGQQWMGAGEDLRTTLWYRQVPARAERIIHMIEVGQ